MQRVQKKRGKKEKVPIIFEKLADERKKKKKKEGRVNT